MANILNNFQKDEEGSINGVLTDREEIFIDDKELEKKLLRKMDFRIVPLLTFLYLLSFLDRVNIGNAKVAHIEDDIGLIGSQFNICLSIFFVGYILFEIPSNLILIKSSPSIWIPTTMVAWGIVMTLMAFVKNFSELMLARFFLGVCESGLFPGVIYFITRWYKRSEQNFRIALFTVGNSFAGSFSGLLAYCILRLLGGKLNLKGWQWLFLVEGVVTIIVAILAYFLISDYPEKTKWLSDEERRFATERLKNDAGKAHVIQFDKKQLFAALKDWKVYLAMLQLCTLSIPIYSFSLFLPTIVNGLGFDYVTSQLLSVPPFLCASMSTLTVAILSDRKLVRGPFIIMCSSFGIVGYILLGIPSSGVAVKYIGTCIVGIGIFPCLATSIAWLTNNIGGHVKRGIAAAMILMSGNLGGIIASQIYRPKDAPYYLFGHLLTATFLIIANFISILQYFLFKNINKKKRENPQSFLEGRSEEKIKNMGDLHPDFIYSL
ncbi:major facilitator superfamily domain-containing protein [Glomus cerebriforme]|uniref:Major facilitator superfamily domain-containing protein n=1 Tax=Glomus cerebriforme TaxID=658196 RepID=A0A397TPU8_9GLOM|nr:major facilitator superfamily domain-containing protein [Glomus cerebriforme]